MTTFKFEIKHLFGGKVPSKTWTTGLAFFWILISFFGSILLKTKAIVCTFPIFLLALQNHDQLYKVAWYSRASGCK